MPDVAPLICECCAEVGLLYYGVVRKVDTDELQAIKSSPSWKGFIQPAKEAIRAMTATKTIDFQLNNGDHGPANPKYPKGVHLSLLKTKDEKYCVVRLPYPATRCGTYSIGCRECGQVAKISAAGQPDDPVSLRLPCKRRP